MEERSFHPLDYVSVARRRKLWFIIPLAVCITGGALLVLILPKEYKSDAEIGIAAPTLSPELLRGVSSLDIEERRRAISQQLLSPAVLERVVREEQIRPGQPVHDTAGWLRNTVEKYIEVPRPIGRTTDDNTKGLDRIKLGYVDSDPHRTQRITNKLATVFVEENSKLRTERAENTAEILAQQMRASQQRLTTLQEQLRRQKEANIGRLPTQMDANIQMVNGLHSRLESLSTQLSIEQNRLTVLDQQLDEMRRASPAVTVNPGASPAAAEMVAAQSRINSLTQEMAAARALGYTDQHPEIRRINRELAAARTALTGAGGSGSRDELLGLDPLYKERMLDRQLTQNRIRELRRAVSAATSQIGTYQSRLESAPMVEQALLSVTQEYELEKKRYEELSSKHQDALVGEDLARKQEGERFSVLYPAYLPTKPISPNALRIMLMATALGLVLGAMMVVGREFLDRSVYDTRALSEFEIPVLGEIPRIQKAA